MLIGSTDVNCILIVLKSSCIVKEFHFKMGHLEGFGKQQEVEVCGEIHLNVFLGS